MHRYFKIVLSIVLIASLKSFAQYGLPKPKNGNTYVIAHRGEHNGIPENSLAAYQKAIDLGCDFVEIAVRTTKDGEFVSVHNATIDAYVIGTSGKVSDLTLSQLRALDIGIKLDEKWRNTKIPTFEEILALCQGKIGIYLDLKEADPKALISIIKNYGMQEAIVWYISAKDHKSLTDIGTNCPECLIMPDPGNKRNIQRVLNAYAPKIMASDMGHISKSFVKKLHANNVKVFVDDDGDNEQQWQMLLDLGVDGIQTDSPEKLIKFISATKSQ
ncbi:glycerophosphodiester phosphodiesterase family protein [Arenibacter sp. BSSL-BM3]|uniref:Glycerophosphodiester phosphodiesterase family protein n=1 Tax=Arenibacter arenosicollis TaxID=2762274 RepID=A0ABR7QRB4_9FLAO|nr:glycerophosphodiester phosphodiesterase family protein [Arenibacter arenosicollis]MBC8769515.1 glycerophosphodiester phosphodiesterase family protein [Arenibacter arenosicollis]